MWLGNLNQTGERRLLLWIISHKEFVKNEDSKNETAAPWGGAAVSAVSLFQVRCFIAHEECLS
jgi:hypothetical protein